MQFGKRWKEFRDGEKTNAACEEDLRQRMLLIEKEIQEIKDARYDAIIPVSKGRSTKCCPRLCTHNSVCVYLNVSFDNYQKISL